MSDDSAPRDIEPKLTFREWTRTVMALENQSRYHRQRMDNTKLPLLRAYHWEQSMLCDRVVMELKRAQIEVEGGHGK